MVRHHKALICGKPYVGCRWMTTAIYDALSSINHLLMCLIGEPNLCDIHTRGGRMLGEPHKIPIARSIAVSQERCLEISMEISLCTEKATSYRLF